MKAPAYRADFELTRARFGDVREPERIRAHYELERRLADQLRAAAPQDRAALYSVVYNELFDSLPDHPQKAATARPERADEELKLLSPMIGPQTRFLEVGCGDAAVAFAAAARGAMAYGLDVTEQLVGAARPANFRFLKTGGTDIPLPDGVVDLAYSNQLMEHLHPDDAARQLGEIHRVLATGGAYVCATPSRWTGPHDISAFFDYEATGFHMLEYDRASLRRIFRAAGFRSMTFLWTPRGRTIRVPTPMLLAFEAVIAALPTSLRSRLTRRGPIYTLLSAKILATK